MAITLEAAVCLGAMPLYVFGTDEQRDRWLPELCSGDRLAAFGLTEPGGGTDIPGGTRTRARHMQGGAEAGGEWVIDGSKAFITNAGTDITSLVTVLAITGVCGGPAQGAVLDHRSFRHAGLHRGPALLEGGLVRLGHP